MASIPPIQPFTVKEEWFTEGNALPTLNTPPRDLERDPEFECTVEKLRLIDGFFPAESSENQALFSYPVLSNPAFFASLFSVRRIRLTGLKEGDAEIKFVLADLFEFVEKGWKLLQENILILKELVDDYTLRSSPEAGPTLPPAEAQSLSKIGGELFVPPIQDRFFPEEKLPWLVPAAQRGEAALRQEKVKKALLRYLRSSQEKTELEDHYLMSPVSVTSVASRQNDYCWSEEERAELEGGCSLSPLSETLSVSRQIDDRVLELKKKARAELQQICEEEEVRIELLEEGELLVFGNAPRLSKIDAQMPLSVVQNGSVLQQLVAKSPDADS